MNLYKSNRKRNKEIGEEEKIRQQMYLSMRKSRDSKSIESSAEEEGGLEGKRFGIGGKGLETLD